MLHDFVVGKEFQVLPDSSFNQPCKWIIPIKEAEQFTEKYIYCMLLLNMHEFMADNFFQFFCGVKLPVKKDGITKGERNDFFVDIEHLDAGILKKPRARFHSPDRIQLNQQPPKHDCHS